jgi:hypothetical protein
VLLWSVLPGAAFGPFALLVLGAVTVVVAVPVAATVAMVAPTVIEASRGPDLDVPAQDEVAQDEASTDAGTGEEVPPARTARPSPRPALDLAKISAAGADPLASVPGLKLGLVPLLLWCAAALAVGAAALTSVSSALGALLYVGAREGNDALPSRDAFLSRQAAPPAAGTA